MKTIADSRPIRSGGAPRQEAPAGNRKLVVRRWLGCLAFAWLVPALAQVLGVDWLLPPLVLLVTASLLRAGHTLLDRLMFATAVLLGTTCAAGLLFTLWPFGLAPVPVAGTALTVLGTIGVLTGRSPRLPRPAASDALTVVAAVGVCAYVAMPYLRTDATGRLALLLGGEDHARHVAIFDTVRRIGGYAYWHTPDRLPDLWEVLRYYPTGWHLTAGTLDGFARSSTAVGDPTSAMDHYTWFLAGSYGLFALALLWSAQWIGGPLLGHWRLPLVAFLAGQLVYSDLPVMTVFGFPSELFGLTALVLLVAVLSRRAARVREQVVVVGALLVVLGFGYELYLPCALLAAATWAVRRRRPLLRHRRFVVAVAVVAGALAVLPIGMGLLLGGHGDLVSAPGGILRTSRAMLLVLGLVIAAALVRPAVLRLRIWRSYLWSLGAVLTLPAGMLGFRLVTGAATPYYLEKALHGVLVILLAGLGAVCVTLPRSAGARHRWRPDLAQALPAGLITAAVAVSAGAVVEDTPWRPGAAESVSRKWHSGEPTKLNAPIAGAIRAVAHRYPHRAGTVTVVVTGDFLTSYLQTLYLSTLQRTGGVTDAVLYGNGGFSTEPRRLADILARTGRPVLLVVSSAAGPVAAEVRRQRPELPVSVVPLPE